MNGRVGMLVAAALAVLLVGVTVVVAQPGGGGRTGGGPGRAGRGMMGGNMAVGTVVDGNLQEGWISVSMGMGRGGPGGPGGEDAARRVTLSQQSALVRIEPAALADLEEGNGLMVNGVPTAMSGSRFVTGANSVPVANAMTFLSGGGFGGGFRGGPGAGVSVVPPTTASATGRIVGLDPLRVQVSDSLTVEITPEADATFLRVATAPWEALTKDTRVYCTGESQQDGSLAAATVVILPADMGTPMGMGPGGPGAMGGPPAAPPQ